jgi:hypothetical protein
MFELGDGKHKTPAMSSFFQRSDHSVLRTCIFHKSRAKSGSKRSLKANSSKTWSDMPKPQALLPRLAADSFKVTHVSGLSAVAAVRDKMVVMLPPLRLWNWRFIRNLLIWSQIWTSWGQAQFSRDVKFFRESDHSVARNLEIRVC